MRVAARGAAEATTIEVGGTMTETENAIEMTGIEEEVTEENGGIVTDTTEGEEVIIG